MASAMRKMAVYLGLVEDDLPFPDKYDEYDEYDEDFSPLKQRLETNWRYLILTAGEQVFSINPDKTSDEELINLKE